MKTNIQLASSQESKKLIQYINRKIKQMSKDLTVVREIDVKLRQDIYTGDKLCEMYLKTTDKNIFAIQKGRTFEYAVDKVIAKLKSQLTVNDPSDGPTNSDTESGENNKTLLS